jgi:hypothetical protein
LPDEYHLARPADVNSFTPLRTRLHRCELIRGSPLGAINFKGCRKYRRRSGMAVRSRIGKNPSQFSKIDGDIEKSSDFISGIVRPRPSDHSHARGREPTPPVPGIQHDHSRTEDFG